MDQGLDQAWWLASPAPAVFVRPQPANDAEAPFEWTANEAARLWAGNSTEASSVLGRVAQDVGRLSLATTAGAVGSTRVALGPQPDSRDRAAALRWHSMPWSGGWLAWCLPDELYTPTPDDLLERVDILRQSGRVGMFVRDARSGEGRWDHNAFRLWGFKPDDETPHIRTAFERIHPDDRPRMLERLSPDANRAGYADERFRVIHPDGSVRHLHTLVQHIPGPDGQLRQMLGVIVDDTETVNNYLAQRAAAEAAQRALASAGIGFWSLDPRGGDAEWDAGMYALHGREPARGAPSYTEWVEHYAHPDDQPRLRLALQAKAHVERRAYTDHCRIVREDGQVRSLEIAGRYGEQALGRVLCGTMTDVSDKRSVSEALSLELARTRFASESAGLGSWACSLDGEPLHWNAQMYRLHGVDPKRSPPLQQLWAGAHRPVDLARLRQALRRHLAHGEALDHELRTLWPDGSEHWITLRGQRMPGPAGRGERIYGVSWDLTERKQAEREAQAKDAALSALRASHERAAALAETLRGRLRDTLAGERPAVDAGMLLGQLDELLVALHEQAPPAPATSARPLKLLCIETSAVNLMMVEHLAHQRPQLALHTACTAQAGLALARELRPDVLLVDMNLPDLNGIELLQRLRQHPELRGTACVMLSSSAVPMDADLALAAGFDAYWTKPIAREVFLDAMDALAHGRPLQRRPEVALAPAPKPLQSGTGARSKVPLSTGKAMPGRAAWDAHSD